jgi:hypothetical protein
MRSVLFAPLAAYLLVLVTTVAEAGSSTFSAQCGGGDMCR